MYFKNEHGDPYYYVSFRFLILRWLDCMQEIRKIKPQTQLHSFLLNSKRNKGLGNTNKEEFKDFICINDNKWYYTFKKERKQQQFRSDKTQFVRKK